ncbi:MAG: Dabb family protein [Saprospiraceae bacterium]|nr:Dabb family protein [Saprospiraceae bacterium]
MSSKPPIVHHVFFWLKNPESSTDLNQLLAGIRALAAISTVRELHVGVPAATGERDVIDNSWSASELMFFDTVEDQDAYQVDPLHQKFIAECGHLWRKVLVYDVQG